MIEEAWLDWHLDLGEFDLLCCWFASEVDRLLALSWWQDLVWVLSIHLLNSCRLFFFGLEACRAVFPIQGCATGEERHACPDLRLTV